jgi:hypothetical protein
MRLAMISTDNSDRQNAFPIHANVASVDVISKGTAQKSLILNKSIYLGVKLISMTKREWKVLMHKSDRT